MFFFITVVCSFYTLSSFSRVFPSAAQRARHAGHQPSSDTRRWKPVRDALVCSIFFYRIALSFTYLIFLLGGYGYPTFAYQYGPLKMCQINACEWAANQSRLCETRLVLKLYYTDSITYLMCLVSLVEWYCSRGSRKRTGFDSHRLKRWRHLTRALLTCKSRLPTQQNLKYNDSLRASGFRRVSRKWLWFAARSRYALI